MGNSSSRPTIHYCAPSKEFKEKMTQMGVNLPDLHKEYNLPAKYKDSEHFQKKLLTKIDKWEDGKISYESFSTWQTKLALEIVERNPSLQDLISNAIDNDSGYIKTGYTRPELTHLLHGVASKFNEDDIDYYLNCNRTEENNTEHTRRVDSKVKKISDNDDDLPQWIMSEPTSQKIITAIDRRINRVLNPDNFLGTGRIR